MSESLEELILKAVEKKQGNKDFSLSFIDCGKYLKGIEWVAEIGNPCTYVRIGEVAGEISANGLTPTEAVKALIAELDELNDRH